MVGVAGKSKGCNTCRARKIACDQQKPACARCTRSNRVCGGYERSRVFVTVQPGAKKKHVYLKSSPSPSEWPTEGSPRSVETSTLTLGGDDQALCSFRERAPAYTLLQRHHESHNLVLSFLANCLPPEWSKSPSKSWITLLTELPIKTKALEVSGVALAAAAVGHKFNDPALVRYSHSLYTRGLQQLQRALWNRRLAQDDATLAACMALSLYEATECPNAGSEGYFGHCQGLLALVEARGIEAHCSGPGHQLFLGVRMPGIIYALENHSSSFLSDAAWLNQPWGRTPKTPFTQVVDCLAQAPGILQQVFLLPSLSPDQQIEACFQLITECWQIDVKLDMVYAAMQGGSSDPLYWPVASKNPPQAAPEHTENLFPFVFHFADFETAATLILLWAVRVLLWSGLCNLYDGMFPNSCMLPADESVGPLRALGYRREYVSMAHHVCQSVEYLMQDEFLLAGPLSVTPALGIVIDSLRYQPGHAAVVAWLRAALDLVRQKGLGVLEHSR
ncbi:Zn(II)2Cys6 transcription factor domain-containing protein [Aspergillus fijiensis CBS 313.89]|uniref:C6 zinc finger domain-containing protein n=1 Tax=Aspergillus fijiensis CBS 313.89 TaxID=1448319 RepID=A0A8G1W2M1_9EURO|nr:C6 zinc finger domain-containing protein [Aspergillus fijiensis CBS 313.89]RAK82185.1 C6 zinc finger domain-containing protein [Aspergillus fijiensis CBS 313.89]